MEKFKQKYGTKGTGFRLLVEEFVHRAPEFKGDRMLAEAIGVAMDDLERMLQDQDTSIDSDIPELPEPVTAEDEYLSRGGQRAVLSVDTKESGKMKYLATGALYTRPEDGVEMVEVRGPLGEDDIMIASELQGDNLLQKTIWFLLHQCADNAGQISIRFTEWWGDKIVIVKYECL